jgi:hypothetical protein
MDPSPIDTSPYLTKKYVILSILLVIVLVIFIGGFIIYKKSNTSLPKPAPLSSLSMNTYSQHLILFKNYINIIKSENISEYEKFLVTMASQPWDNPEKKQQVIEELQTLTESDKKNMIAAERVRFPSESLTGNDFFFTPLEQVTLEQKTMEPGGYPYEEINVTWEQEGGKFLWLLSYRKDSDTNELVFLGAARKKVPQEVTLEEKKLVTTSFYQLKELSTNKPAALKDYMKEAQPEEYSLIPEDKLTPANDAMWERVTDTVIALSDFGKILEEPKPIHTITWSRNGDQITVKITMDQSSKSVTTSSGTKFSQGSTTALYTFIVKNNKTYLKMLPLENFLFNAVEPILK